MTDTDPGLSDGAFSQHGGRLATARAQFPNAIEPWIDLSTGISPWAYPMPPLPVECWTRLPDPLELASLIAAARTAYSVPKSAEVIAVAGSDLAISLIPRLVSTKADIAVVAPTYSSHAKAWMSAGHRVGEVDGPDRIATNEIGVVVNPNNPDGRRWQPQQLYDVANRMGRGNGFLIVDEAFCDVTPHLSALEPDADLSRIVVLRSFGKFYGLAGLRLGFAVTGHPIGHALEAALSDWPISGPAIAIGCAALADTAWRGETLIRLEETAQRLDQTLQTAGLEIVGGTSLFRLARHANARALFTRLARHGILVRPFAQDDLLRFGLPAGEAEFTRLRKAVAG